MVLVLDDFHVIHEPAVHQRLTELLGYQVEQLRLLLLTRSDPALPLHRLRLNDQLGELRSRDLAFGAADATHLFTSHGLEVGAEDAALLVERTEGWPAGLRLAALHLSREGGQAAASFAGDDQSVTGYLAEEVLASQPPELRDFLLRTSVAERLTSDLARRLTGQERAQHHLETLEASNAFVVSLGPGRQWFRYHGLLREMLQHRLRVDAPELVPELHRTAAEWFAGHGQVIEAMGHAADAEDWRLLGRIFVEQGLPQLLTVERTALHNVLLRVPARLFDDSTELAVCGAAVSFYESRWADLDQSLITARTLLGAGPHAERIEACLSLLATVVARVDGNADAIMASSANALDALPHGGSDDPATSAYRVIALNNLGSGRLWSGAVTAAEISLREAVTLTRERDIEVTEINALSHLSLAAVLSGRVTEGLAIAEEAAELVERRGWVTLPQAALGHLALALGAVHRHEVATAQEQIVRAREAGRHERIARIAVDLTQTRLDLTLGRLDAASTRLDGLTRDLPGWQLPPTLARWRAVTQAELCLATGDAQGAVEAVGTSADHEAPYADERLVLARALLLLGEPGRAETVLAPLRDSGSEAHLVEAWVLTALAADSAREDNRALSALGRALHAAAPGVIRRPFVVHRERLARLWEQLGHIDPAAADLAQDLLGPLEPRTTASSPPTGLAEELTDRELVVLRYLATMRTNDEIAADLFVSVNTVKAHLKRAFRKLGVDSRREAVRRARELGLLVESELSEEQRTV